MLPSKVSEPFDSPDWLFELKWGGVRALAFVERGKVAILGQNGAELTGAYPELQTLATQLKGTSAVLDGEIVALSADGVPRIELLRQRLDSLLKYREAHLPRLPFSYQIGDIIALDGVLQLESPLWQRKNLLHSHFQPSPVAQACDFIEGEGTAFFEAVCEHRLEGIIAKNKFSPYVPGKRTSYWLEVPTKEIGHYVIGGYTFGGGNQKRPFETLLLGAFRGHDLVYVGRATTGLSNPEGWRTVKLLEGMHTSSCPFVDPPSLDRFSYWCEPSLVCQVYIGERSPQGEPRFAIFVALRPDLAPEDCEL